jgi:putative SOS response-associated peptidase YedK
MCGRFSQSHHSEWLAERFGAAMDEELPPGRYNTAPTDPIRILVEDAGRRRLTAAQWGFRPFWLNAGDKGWINAKAERALESRAFGPALRRHRCVIPAQAFYEWRRETRPPQPFAIGSADDQLFAFAGIWTDASRTEPATAAILTIGANQAMAPLHHRMPVILEDVDAWLDTKAPLDVIASLLAPAPDEALRIWPVATLVNNVRNDGPELLVPSG